MSDIQISYERAIAFSPTEAQAAIAKLRKSKSKVRDADPATLNWRFSWGEEVKCETARDVFSGLARKRREAEAAQTLEQRIEARKKRVFAGVFVSRYYEPFPPGVIPEEILRQIIECETKAKSEEDRAAALTPEQREAEVNQLLRQLGGMGGFVVVSAPPSP